MHLETKEQFMCEICGVVWKNRWLLDKHQFSHNNHQEYACQTCHTAYKTSGALATHEKNCNGTVYTGWGLEKSSLTFMCEFCNKEFSTKERLEIRVRNHTCERPFQCKECDKNGKTFTSKSSLNMHLNIHTGEQPFKCKIFNKAFTQKGGLVQHIFITQTWDHMCAPFVIRHSCEIHIWKYISKPIQVRSPESVISVVALSLSLEIWRSIDGSCTVCLNYVKNCLDCGLLNFNTI